MRVPVSSDGRSRFRVLAELTDVPTVRCAPCESDSLVDRVGLCEQVAGSCVRVRRCAFLKSDRPDGNASEHESGVQQMMHFPAMSTGSLERSQIWVESCRMLQLDYKPMKLKAHSEFTCVKKLFSFRWVFALNYGNSKKIASIFYIFAKRGYIILWIFKWICQRFAWFLTPFIDCSVVVLID